MNEQLTNASEANAEANTDIVPAFESSLFDQSNFEPLIDTGLEYIELGIDSFLKDGLLKDIPIVGSLVGIGKFMGRVHDYNSLNQTLNFIRSFNQHRDNAKTEKHRNKLRANPKLMEKELGHVLIIIDRNTDILIARSIIMMIMVFIQNIHVLNCRSEKNSIFTTSIMTNKFIIITIHCINKYCYSICQYYL